MAASTASFQFQLSGYAPANRDALVRLTSPTGQVIERKPFLDGSVFIRDLAPGPYEVEVTHPNLLVPIDRRKVQLFPQRVPTKVRIPVPADLFRDTPIRDVPDADLTPVQQAAEDVRARTAPLAAKSPGEVIRAADWNLLATAVADLAGAVGELTQLVAPRGHDHPEIAEKIDEVQGNLRRFADAFGRSLLELRRDIETQKVRRQVDDVFVQAGIGENDDRRVRLNTQLAEMEQAVLADPTVFTTKLAGLGANITGVIQQVADEQDDAEAFLSDTAVQNLNAAATEYAASGRKASAEDELNIYRRSTSKTGGQTLNLVLR